MLTSIRLTIAAFILLAAFAAQSSKDQEKFEFARRQIHTAPNFVPKGGVVPDASTATAIAYAVAVAVPVYGKKMMDDELPFRADLKDGVWTVLGTLHCSSCDGGTAVVQIDKTTGKIVYLTHFK
jgi:hypothetical protein